MDRTADRMRLGETGRVVKLTLTGPFRRRLLELGLTPGVLLTLRYRAPLGDPLVYTLRGYTLSLRASEAAGIHVTTGSAK